MVQELPRSLAGLRRDWADLSIYQRFEAFVAFLLRVVIGAVILVALYRLFIDVWDTLVLRSRNPLEHSVFQRVFGGIMTVLIALEFNHTLKYAITRGRGIIQGRIVLLIALLALARKVMGEVHSQSPGPSPSARQARCSAEVALLAAMPWGAPTRAATASSKRGTTGPWVRKSERSTSTTASMSLREIDCRP